MPIILTNFLSQTYSKMIVRTLLCFLYLLIVPNLYAQDFQWVHPMEGNSLNAVNSLQYDAAGNLYSTGRYGGTIDFDPGPGQYTLTASTATAYILKLDPSGNFLWVKSFGTAGGVKIDLDASGNIYVAGHCSITTDFDPGSGVSMYTATMGSDVFVAKYDPSGNFLWVKNIGGDAPVGYFNSEIARDLKIDMNGDVVVCGNVFGTADFDPGPNVDMRTGAGFSDGFVWKLSSNGDYLWSAQFGGPNEDDAHSLVLDNSGNIYTIGFFRDTVDFDPGSGVFNLISGEYNTDGFVLKLDSDGNFNWVKHMEAFGGSDIAIDENENLYVCGAFRGTVDLDPSTTGVNNFTSVLNDAYFLKLNSSGDFLWAKQISGNGWESAYSIAVDNSGRVHLTGGFSGVCDFDPGSGVMNYTTDTYNDVYVLMADLNGNYLQNIQLGGLGASDSGIDICVDNLGNRYIAGYYRSTIDFDPGSGVVSYSPQGIENGFILKLGMCVGKPQVDVQTACGSYTWLDGITYTESTKSPTVTRVDANGCNYSLSLNLHIIPAGTSTLEWVRNVGNGNSGSTESVVSDADGSVYVVGTFSGTVDFDPGTASFPLTSSGVQDLFVQKLDAAGNFIWAKNVGGTNTIVSTNGGKTIAVDSQGEVYVGGYFEKKVDFDPNAGVALLTSVSGSVDAFILKLSAGGDFQWVKQFGDIGRDQVNSISMDTDDNICATGIFYGDVDFNPGAGTYVLSSVNETAAFISKLKSNGDFIWAKMASGDAKVNALSIVTNSTNDVYVTGDFEGTADFNPGGGVANLTASTVTESDAYLLKLDANGNYQWVRQVEGSSYVSGHAVSVDPNENVYLTGQFHQTAIFDVTSGTVSLLSEGSRDMFVSKFDAGGNCMWVHQVGGEATDIPFSLTVDSEGNSYTTGYFSQKIDFNSGDPSGILTANSYDVFVLKLNTDGEYVWVNQLGGSGNDIGFGIHVDLDGNIYVGGLFETTANFSSNLGGTAIVSNGLQDAFVFKLNQCGGLSSPRKRLYTSIENQVIFNADQKIILYPNPSEDGIFRIVSADQFLEMKVFDMTGRLMPIQTDLVNKTLDCSALIHGEYIVRILTVEGKYTEKVMIGK